MPAKAASQSIIARVSSRLALLWLTLALLVQGFAVQTHTHFGGERYAAAVRRTLDASPDAKKNTPVAPACPLCEEKALFGAYLLGGSVTLVPPAAVAATFTTTSLARLALGATSHGWRSRAPPVFTA
ncbi:MAG: hypothetical protein J0I47_12430 [Sphingomonas sp.]|uniref:hypothetical protein n=1 Tax=Sphingomonas sp. TaxID=28214 RepID=UPI001ACFD1E5|nr:hypothetical protein [Sphingomonas sp.]MBN8809023.1 hypothetical protein [Sphingomonas sp.]